MGGGGGVGATVSAKSAKNSGLVAKKFFIDGSSTIAKPTRCDCECLHLVEADCQALWLHEIACSQQAIWYWL